MENNTPGRELSLGIAGYCVAKFILNWLLGGFDGSMLLITAGIAIILIIAKPPYGNVLVGIILAAFALYYAPGNLRNLANGSLIYLLEGVGDLGCAFLLFTHKGIKERFAQPPQS